MNANKEFMHFKQRGVISIWSGKPLKLVDQFTYLGSNISSTESDVKLHIKKAWIAIDRLSIWKSNLWWNTMGFLPNCGCIICVYNLLLYECTTWTLTKHWKKNLCGSDTRMLHCFEQILKTAPQKVAAVWPFTSHLTNHPSKMKTCWTTSTLSLESCKEIHEHHMCL